MCRDCDSLSVVAPVIAAVALMLHPGEARAYLDAGAGSMIFQAVLGAVVAGVVVVRMYWRRLVGRFRKSASEDERPSVQEDI